MTITPLLLFQSIHQRRAAAHQPARYPSLTRSVLCYITQGEGRLYINEAIYSLKPLQLYLLTPGMRLTAVSDSSQAAYYLIFVDGVLMNTSTATFTVLQQPQEAFLPLKPGRIPLAPAAQIQPRLKELNEAYRRKESRFVLNTRFQELIQLIISNILPAQEQAGPENGIEQSMEYMHLNYPSKIKLDTLAELAGFTPTSYSREFKKTIGVSPIEYLNSYRISQAKQMLLDKRRSVKEVALHTGFGSEFYFSRMFRKETGIAPTLYMKRKEIRIAVASCFRFEDTLLSLGVKPVLSTNCHKNRAMSQQEHHVLLAQRLDQLRDAAPELILCDHQHLAYQDQLRQIAPTLIVEHGMDWRLQHQQLAEALGREKEAAYTIKLLDKKLSDAKKTLQAHFGSDTVTVMRVIDKLIRIQGQRNHPLNELIYRDIGLNPGYCVHSSLMNIEYSPDKYPDLGTDYLFVQYPPFYAEDEAVFQAIQETPKWRAMKAVSSNQIYHTSNWAALSWTPAGRIRIMDELLQAAGARP
ncbi:helix-turn-helix domain-containing protein [Paenibacillus sp. y28]|uniref:helix-turn-helix domain-containing protein n=1 Tax=Paenibacillus sp. y28 TaxID=3129110 RepID=UPI003017B9BB